MLAHVARRAIVLGGTGAIGFATAKRLLAGGWRVDVTGRDPSHVPLQLTAAGATFTTLDRDDSPSLAALVGAGADLLVDCVCFTARQAEALVPLLSSVSSSVMISSKAVYVDDLGRHSNSDTPACFAAPIAETQQTLRPNNAPFDSREGYGPNKVAAEQVLLNSPYPVNILRPSKVHGAWSRQPREWVFVKRVLDRRPVVVLANRGLGVDHPSAAANIAALIDIVAARPGQRILNIADPDAPNALAISRVVAAHLGHGWREYLLDASAGDGSLGVTPWNRLPPVVLDTSAAEALGYRPVGRYAETVTQELDWLISAARDAGSAWAIPAMADQSWAAMFDYAAEDRAVTA
jgi:nucleoside-diphosphate-sugar epimerase